MQIRSRFSRDNDQVHGAAVNNIDFRTRVVGGSRATPCCHVFGVDDAKDSKPVLQELRDKPEDS